MEAYLDALAMGGAALQHVPSGGIGAHKRHRPDIRVVQNAVDCRRRAVHCTEAAQVSERLLSTALSGPAPILMPSWDRSPQVEVVDEHVRHLHSLPLNARART